VGMVVLEAAIIGLAAGVIGVIVGSGVTCAMALRNGWPLAIASETLGPAVAAAALAGVVAGLVPGIRAVQVTPSQALRRE
jgi:ABC-type antimicrobial peptide transport system permease subunit